MPPTPEEMVASLGEEKDGIAAEREMEGTAEERLKEEKKQKKQPTLPGPDPKDLMEALPALVRLFKNLIKSISLETISCRVSFGFDDPADTAIISGYIWSMVSAIGLYRADLCIEPYFEGERLDGNLLADIRARLFWIVLALIKALGEEKIRRLVIKTAKRGTA